MCGQCEACLQENCRECRECLDRPKFCGPNKRRQKCAKRLCPNMNPPTKSLAAPNPTKGRKQQGHAVLLDPTHESPSDTMAAPAPSSSTAQASPTKSKQKRSSSKHNGSLNTPLFSFQTLSTTILGGRPKRKLKEITRFDPQSKPSAASSCKIGEGFQCQRCNCVCSYDSRMCKECDLECYYEAGVGAVTLKERR